MANSLYSETKIYFKQSHYTDSVGQIKIFLLLVKLKKSSILVSKPEKICVYMYIFPITEHLKFGNLKQETLGNMQSEDEFDNTKLWK